MTRGSARPIESIQWQPAERLGQLSMDAQLRPRALRHAQIKPAGLWARRARIALRSAPLLTQELFLPAMGRV
jgi:chorismate-pyruvate lyase